MTEEYRLSMHANTSRDMADYCIKDTRNNNPPVIAAALVITSSIYALTAAGYEIAAAIRSTKKDS